jgi:hypothetical protein
MLNVRTDKRWGLPCFYCGVDSTELKIFLIVVIGGVCLTTVLIALWAWGRGMFRRPEEIKHTVFEAEERT